MPGPAVAVDEAGGLLGPVAGQRLDGEVGDAALLGGPGRRLGHTVLFAQDVVLELLEAVGVGGDVLLVVGAFGDPHVGDGELQRGVGVGKDGDPLVGMNRGAVVEVGADVDGLEADLGEPVAQVAREQALDGVRSGLRVAAPEQQQLAVLGDVGVEVGGRHHLPHRLAAPHVLGAPVLAFPAVQVAHLDGVAAQQREQAVGAAVAGAEVLGLAVHVGLGEHGLGPVGLLHAPQLGRHQLGGLVPGDAHVLARAPVLGVAPAGADGPRRPSRVPVHALERIAHPVLGVDPLLVGLADGAQRGAQGRIERLSLRLHLPGVEVLLVVLRLVVEGPDPRDPAVLDVHEGGGTGISRSDEARAPDDLLVRSDVHVSCSPAPQDFRVSGISPRLTSLAVSRAEKYLGVNPSASILTSYLPTARSLNQKSP